MGTQTLPSRLCQVLAVLASATVVHAASDRAVFDRKVAPILIKHCLDCHSGSKPEAGLDLSQAESAHRGGESGKVIEPGVAGNSLLWKRVAADEMPPENPLNEAEKQILRDWISQGAIWGTSPIDPFRATTDSRAGYDWWALQPLRRSAIPAVDSQRPVHSPIDAFVIKRLQSVGLEPSEPAAARTLIRRLHFDLIGLPPSPAEVERFEQACRSDRIRAIEELIDQLLGSRHFGERWGRHWLDVVRFGESQGFERDKLRTNSWHYRDWVIDAFNQDMPYDEFARHQIAGDILEPSNPDAIIATGFLVAGPWDEVGQNQQSPAMKAVVRQDELEDYVGTIGQTFLGLTINCARCHDHKFDPIRQKEYYQLAAAVGGVRHGSRKITRPEAQRALDQLNATIASLKEELEKLPATDRKRRGELEQSIAEHEARRDPLQPVSVYAVVPKPPEPAFVLHRGEPANRGEPVAAGGVATVPGPSADFELPMNAPDADRRRRLAAWITDKQNALFARVIVNRLWHYHFGAGLVETPNDFGFNGGRPSHPLLLDWLATELIRSNWQLKPIHRLIVSSATYQQRSLSRPECAAVDANNRLMWRKKPLRMDAETLRDAILSVSGQLNPRYGGPPYQDFETYTNNTQFYVMTDRDHPDVYRRTVYRTWIRSGRNHFLDAFDCPDPSTTAPKRAVTTTPIQSLALLNNSLVLRMADRFASRVKTEVGDDAISQVQRVFQLAYGRRAQADQIERLAEFVRAHGLPAFCRVVLNSNEFIYVD